MLYEPFPNNPNPVESFNVKTDFDLQGDGLVWYAHPQLFFNCTLCPTGAQAAGYSSTHKEVSLVYFSTFETETEKVRDRREKDSHKSKVDGGRGLIRDRLDGVRDSF